jgi:hypothetical protein
MQNRNSNLKCIARAGVYALCIAAGAAAGLPLNHFPLKAQERNAAPSAGSSAQAPVEATGFYCNLKAFTPAERARHEQLSKKLREARVEIKELSNGFAFRLQNEAVSLTELAEWVAGERKCCPFFDFGIDLQGDGGPLWLELKGNDGVKQFMRSEFKLPLAQTDKPAASNALSEALDVWVTNTEKLLVPAADAMPEDRYSFAPGSGECKGEFKGVRTFTEQVKHLAAANFQLGSLTLGEKPPHGEHGEAAPESIQTKAQIMDYLRSSFAYLHRAAAAIDEKNAAEPIELRGRKNGGTRVGFLVDALAHSQNHYGQMVEYLRMNGIVPPASR